MAELNLAGRALRRAWRQLERMPAWLRARWRPLKVVVIQSADTGAGGVMLAQSARTAVEYCRRHGYERREFLGLYRGFHPWQASFNRVFMLKELLDEGYSGWVLYLDMDAVIVDLDFNLYRVIPFRPCALVACQSGATPAHWDINNGIFLLNLGSEDGRTIVERWYAAAMAIPEELLRKGVRFGDPTHDQRQLQELLRDDPVLARRALHHGPADLLNDERARFIRHFLSASGSMEMRTAKVKAESHAALGRG